jgi:hypothetical protein
MCAGGINAQFSCTLCGTEFHPPSDSRPVSVLWSAFPELREKLDDGDSGSYYIYDRFADHLASHCDDKQLWQRSYAFFNSLAVGGETLQEILVVGLFEPLCLDPVFAGRLKSNVGLAARKLLDGMCSTGEPSKSELR